MFCELKHRKFVHICALVTGQTHIIERFGWNIFSTWLGELRFHQELSEEAAWNRKSWFTEMEVLSFWQNPHLWLHPEVVTSLRELSRYVSVISHLRGSKQHSHPVLQFVLEIVLQILDHEHNMNKFTSSFFFTTVQECTKYSEAPCCLTHWPLGDINVISKL